MVAKRDTDEKNQSFVVAVEVGVVVAVVVLQDCGGLLFGRLVWFWLDTVVSSAVGAVFGDWRVGLAESLVMAGRAWWVQPDKRKKPMERKKLVKRKKLMMRKVMMERRWIVELEKTMVWER